MKKPNPDSLRRLGKPLRPVLVPLCAAAAAAAACALSPAACSALRSLALRLSALWGRLWRLFPVTAAGFAVLLALPAVLCALLAAALRRGRRGVRRALRRLACVAAWLLCAFVLLFGVHYQAPPLSQTLGLSVRPFSAAELCSLARFLAEKVNELAPSVPRSDEGVCDFGSFDELTACVAQGYDALCTQTAAFDTPGRSLTPRSTQLLAPVMARAGITGFYFPFTAEPVVSLANVQSSLPFTIAHEWAHARGVGPEAECNFSAFLACTAASDTRTQYSGMLSAYVYVSNALYTYSYDDWVNISRSLHPLVQLDLQVQRDFWQQFEGPAQDVGSAVNDAYIKATGQPDGVQSYGKMVDLLISWYLAR